MNPKCFLDWFSHEKSHICVKVPTTAIRLSPMTALESNRCIFLVFVSTLALWGMCGFIGFDYDHNLCGKRWPTLAHAYLFVYCRFFGAYAIECNQCFVYSVRLAWQTERTAHRQLNNSSSSCTIWILLVEERKEKLKERGNQNER